MYGPLRDEVAGTLAQIREAGLYKPERQLTSAQHAKNQASAIQSASANADSQAPLISAPPAGSRGSVRSAGHP